MERTFQGYRVAQIFYNCRQLEGDVPAIVMDGRTMVPLRLVAEAFGAHVRWEASSSAVYVTHPAPVSEQEPAPAPAGDVVRIGLLAPLSK